MKFWITILISAFILACGNSPEMYEASNLSEMMRDMVNFSKEAKDSLKSDYKISVPSQFYDLASQEATRDEHKDELFQSMSKSYINALKGIERGDSQVYYYNQSIAACKSCHNSYCGGPLVVIDKLSID